MSRDTQTTNVRQLFKTHRGKIEGAGFLLSMGVGTGIGALLGTLVFPGLGTAAGALIGGALGAGSATLGICLARTIVRTSDLATGVSMLGFGMTSIGIGALVGGVIGSFVFPLLGSALGTLIGAAIAGVASLLVLMAVHAIPAVKRRNLDASKPPVSVVDESDTLPEKEVVLSPSRPILDPGARSYGTILTYPVDSDTDDTIDDSQDVPLQSGLGIVS